MKSHVLKTHPGPFQAVWDGLKPYEVRVNDRDYEVGDHAVLREYDPNTGTVTGRGIQFLISYMTSGGQWGLPENLCVFGFRDRVCYFLKD